MTEKIDVESVKDALLSSVNNTFLQQFLANQISTLAIEKAWGSDATFELRHAFPRDAAVVVDVDRSEATDNAVTSATLRTADLFALASLVTQDKSRNAESILTEAVEYAHSIELIRSGVVIPSSADLTRKIDEIEATHPTFNAAEPLRFEQLKKLAEADGYEYHELEDIALLSLCALRDAGTPRERYAIVVRAGLHPALRTFLLAHELGHLFLHKDHNSLSRHVASEDLYLRSAHAWGHLENEADSVALVMLFPTPYLAWCEVEGRLDAESLVEHFLAETDGEVPRARLRERMLQYARKRIASYELFKRAVATRRENGIYLGDRPLRTERLRAIKATLGEERLWLVTNQENQIVDCSETFATTLGRVRADITGTDDASAPLVPDAMRPRMLARRRFERTVMRPVFYFPRFVAASGAVYESEAHAYPIVSREGEYGGTMTIAYSMREAATRAHVAPRVPHQLRFTGDHAIDYVRDRSEVDAATERRFRRLVEEWQEERGPSSLASEYCMLRPYQEIIGMGEKALPLLLREVESNFDNWYWALHVIAGHSPVPPEDRGINVKMREAWLRWGRENGYL